MLLLLRRLWQLTVSLRLLLLLLAHVSHSVHVNH
jgi:hypothetical protein